MKCFVCGAKCVTLYYCNNRAWNYGEKITHVGKACPVEGCGWASYPTKVPGTIPS
jgi:hypothetical protein